MNMSCQRGEADEGRYSAKRRFRNRSDRREGEYRNSGMSPLMEHVAGGEKVVVEYPSHDAERTG